MTYLKSELCSRVWNYWHINLIRSYSICTNPTKQLSLFLLYQNASKITRNKDNRVSFKPVETDHKHRQTYTYLHHIETFAKHTIYHPPLYTVSSPLTSLTNKYTYTHTPHKGMLQYTHIQTTQVNYRYQFCVLTTHLKTIHSHTIDTNFSCKLFIHTRHIQIMWKLIYIELLRLELHTRASLVPFMDDVAIVITAKHLELHLRHHFPKELLVNEFIGIERRIVSKNALSIITEMLTIHVLGNDRR